MNIKTKLFLVISFLCVIGIGELFARYYLGLGTPPLFVAHPKIEYMYKPDQDLYRFGNHIIINHFGMRTAPFDEHPLNDFRVMIFGDSVLDAGGQTGHSELATTLLQEKLSATTERKVIVGNISAKSWGPGNWLAYAEEYGFFNAQVIILLISSHDYTDNPTFEPLNENIHPTETPIAALVEGVTRYFPRYLPQVARTDTPNNFDQFAEQTSNKEVTKALNDLRVFLSLAKKYTNNVLVYQHWEQKEIENGSAKIGNQRIREVCEALGISPISLEPYFRRSLAEGGKPYRDNIHTSILGQELIAEAFWENFPKEALKESSIN